MKYTILVGIFLLFSCSEKNSEYERDVTGVVIVSNINKLDKLFQETDSIFDIGDSLLSLPSIEIENLSIYSTDSI